MPRAGKDRPAPLCPSAQPQSAGAVLIGVIGGTAREPRARFLDTAIPVSDDILQLTGPVQPTEVLRFAAPCIGSACHHFADRKCALAAKVTELVPAVTDELPECAIRPACRWFAEQGPAACQRCPQVVTTNVLPSAEMATAANPGVPPSAVRRERS